MKNKLFSILSVMLIAALSTSTVSAASLKLSSSFKLGSLIAYGDVSGLGRTDVTLVLDASGLATTICTNPGQNDVPGRSYPKISASGLHPLSGNDTTRKNGKAPFSAETVDPTAIDAGLAGCPNSHWTARVAGILWTNATITVHQGFNAPNGPVLLIKNYICSNQNDTAKTIDCVPAP